MTNLLLTIAVFVTQQTAQEHYHWAVPDEIRSCFEASKRQAQAEFSINFGLNPYYLRGDFDGDGIPDNALAVRSNEPERFAIAVRLSQEGHFLLGGQLGRGAKPFLDWGMPNPDNSVVSSGWQVPCKLAVLRKLAYSGTRRNRSMAIKLRPLRGEILYLPEDEGSQFIYFDGIRFRHHTIDSLALINERE